jgi:hypothetical protein
MSDFENATLDLREKRACTASQSDVSELTEF